RPGRHARQAKNQRRFHQFHRYFLLASLSQLGSRFRNSFTFRHTSSVEDAPLKNQARYPPLSSRLLTRAAQLGCVFITFGGPLGQWPLQAFTDFARLIWHRGLPFRGEACVTTVNE